MGASIGNNFSFANHKLITIKASNRMEDHLELNSLQLSMYAQARVFLLQIPVIRNTTFYAHTLVRSGRIQDRRLL